MKIQQSHLGHFILDYRRRHSYLPNAILHAVGIPLTGAALYLAWRGRWLWAIASLVGGYALQWIGHRFQGSEVGEMALVRKIFGKRPGPT